MRIKDQLKLDTDPDDIGLAYDYTLMEWIPDVDWEDYLNNKIEDQKEENIDTLKEMINGYDNKNLKKARLSKVEVTFKCKEYFLVTDDLVYELIQHFLLGHPQKPDFHQKKFKFEDEYLFKYAKI